MPIKNTKKSMKGGEDPKTVQYYKSLLDNGEHLQLGNSVQKLKVKIDNLMSASTIAQELGKDKEASKSKISELTATIATLKKSAETVKLEYDNEIKAIKQVIDEQSQRGEEKNADQLKAELKQAGVQGDLPEGLEELKTLAGKKGIPLRYQGGSKKTRKTTRKTKAIKGGKKTTKKAVKTTQRGRGRPKGSKNKQ